MGLCLGRRIGEGKKYQTGEVINMDNKTLHHIAMLLLWFGGINWGLYGLLGINLVEMFFGGSAFAQIIYILIGVSSVYSFSNYKKK